MATGAQSACPQCGAAIEFGGAHSLATVCAHCRSAVARAGLELSLVGKLPDLVATDSRLELGAMGRLQNRSFLVLGRLQLDEGAGAWDEWYVSYPDGGYGWLAEAQGRLLATRKLESPPPLPRFEAVHAGQVLDLGPAGSVAVEEVGEARFVSAAGELPFRPALGATYRFADASGDEGAYVTVDYGDGSEPLELFAGREASYAEAGLADRAPSPRGGARLAAQALACPNCGGQLSVKSPEAVTLTCPSCRALLDLSHGSLKLLEILKSRSQPALPLGAKGKLRGEELEVIGFLRRSVTVDDIDYEWREYLLHGKGGYRWLSESAGHWTYLWPIPAGKAQGWVSGVAVEIDHRRFKHFQTADPARVLEVQGEFYWNVRVTDAPRAEDYVAPPYMASVEISGREVNWTRGDYVEPGEVWASFAQPGSPPERVGVGSNQPNPFLAGGRVGKAWGLAFLGLVGVAVVSVALAVALPGGVVEELTVPLDGSQPVTLSAPFDIASGPHAVRIESAAPGVNQAWIGLDLALIDDDTGESDAAGLELSHYEGYDDGEHWTEGSRSGSVVVGGVRPGRYLLRVEPQIEKGSGTVPPAATVRVTTGAFQALPPLFAILLIVAWPMLLSIRAAAFEKARWAESDHAPGGSGDDD